MTNSTVAFCGNAAYTMVNTISRNTESLHIQGHTMLHKIASYFNKLFDQPGQTTYGSELEQYIVSKCPQSAAEIDHWTRQFDHQQTKKGWL